MDFRAEEFGQAGLYLLFPGARRIVLTREKIRSFAREFESGLDRLPAKVRNAASFQACPVCPERGQAKFCHALPATLAFFEELQEFRSYDAVCAVYRGPERSLVWVPETTMQEALQFVVMFSLLHYCEVGQKYEKYLQGVHPLMTSVEFIARLHLNIYWDCKADRRKIEQVLETFADEITCTCRCQVKRLQLVCKYDALVNAFVNTQAQIELLATTKGDLLEESLEASLVFG
jgi:hypothetical protein